MAHGILQPRDFHLKAAEDRPSVLKTEMENIPPKYTNTRRTQKLIVS